MNSKELKKRLASGIIDNAYLFYGEEDYIKDTYINLIKDTVLSDDITGMNFTRFDELPTVDEMLEAVESAPFMCDKKVVMFNSVGIMASSLKKDLKNAFTDVLSDIPDYTVIIVKEHESDKKAFSKPVLTAFEKAGSVVESNYLSASDMLSFANKEFGKYKKKITREDLEYLLYLCDSSINSVLREVEKLAMYNKESEIVTRKEIDLLVKKSIEDRVFSLSDAIINKNTKMAFEILEELKLLKNQHPANMIFALVCDHIVGMYVAAVNSKERVPNDVTLRMLDYKPNRAFLINKYVKQASGKSRAKVKELIHLCSELDFKIKNSLVDPYYAIEQLIVKAGE